MKTPLDFRNEVIGKAYDVDGAYGAQCWDGYAYYMQWLGYGYANCTTSGYVKDIYNNRKTNGILNYCDEVFVMQQGDIAVFAVTEATPLSHIAIFMKDIDGKNGLFLGQNQGGVNGAFNEISIPYSSTFEFAFRPKCYKNLFPKPAPAPTPSTGEVLNEIPSDFIRESATFVCDVDKLNIRRAPTTNGALTGDWYENGLSFKYDGYVRRGGYIWCSYIGKDGTRRWVATGETNADGVNVKPYGKFK